MNARRARIVVGSAALMGLFGAASAVPVAAADCAVSAPAYINVGADLLIQGTGFPPSGDVDVALAVKGGGSDAFSVQADGSGALQIALTPETTDIGVTTVTATAGSACSATVTYTVLAAGATPPPATTQPTHQAGPPAGAPSTDTAQPGSGPDASTGVWTMAVVLMALGGVSLFLTRSPQRR